MRNLDYHMHTHFSADSEEDPRAHVLDAISHGLTEICFTDHRDMHYPGMPFELDVPAYQAEIKALQEEFADQITVKWGLEMGLDMNYVDEIKDFVASAPFDFVIGSIHVVDNEEFYETKDYFTKRDREAGYRKYFTAMRDCVREFDCFNTLAHMDYIVRYATYEPAFVGAGEFSDLIGEILDTLVAKDKALEVNTRLFDAPETRDFYKYLLTEFKTRGGKYVTLGTDSHTADRNWPAIDAARELIAEAGFDELTSFSQQQAEV